MSKSFVKKLREAHEGADKLLILLHDCPDPDAMASALALRTVLGRNRQTATIGHLGAPVSRPENVAMMELLEIDVVPVTVEQARSFDSIAMVDVQPSFFGSLFPVVGSVIDHHPRMKGYEADFVKVSVSEGATSTIMTGLLRVSDVEISSRLATALLYGIKTDTFSLSRDADSEDVEAFVFLYKKANLGLLRKIGKAEIPSDDLAAFGGSLARHWINDSVLFVNLGKIEQEYLIPKMADFCMQVKDADWVVAFGILQGSHLVVSLRNVGYVKSAGRVAREVFGMFGGACANGVETDPNDRMSQAGAGGHRSAAKMLVPLYEVKRLLGGASRQKLDKWFTDTFVSKITED